MMFLSLLESSAHEFKMEKELQPFIHYQEADYILVSTSHFASLNQMTPFVLHEFIKIQNGERGCGIVM